MYKVPENILNPTVNTAGLPPELAREFDKNKRRARGVKKLLEEAGGVAHVKQVLVAHYNNTGRVLKKSAMQSILHSYAKKGEIVKISTTVYATLEWAAKNRIGDGHDQ